MDFNRLNQTTFDSLSSILRFQTYHIMLFLIRFVFPPEAYIQEKGKLQRLINPSNSRLAVLLTANNWAVLCGHVALLSGLLPKYVEIYGAVLQMPHYDKFASHAIISFSLIEWVVVGTMLQTLNGRNDMLLVVIQMTDSVDGDYGPEETRVLLRGFTKRLKASTLGLRGMIAGTMLQIGQLAVAFGASYLDGHIHPLEVIGYLWLATSANLYGLYSMIFPAYFMTHLFFMVRIFKCRLKRAAALMSGNHGSSFSIVTRFEEQLMRIHRQLVFYNSGVSRHLLMYDLIFKFSGSLSVSMMVVGEGGGSPGSSLTTGGWFIIIMFAGSYAALHSIYFALAYFPRQAEELFGLLGGISARSGAVQLPKRHFRSQVGHNQPLCHQQSTTRFAQVHRLLKISALAEFTGSSGHRFGFTYSSLYLIRTVDIIENAAMNLYFLVLFYKKLR